MLRKNSENSSGAEAKNRWYLLRVTDKASAEASLSLFGALSHKEKAFSEIREEGSKAFQSGYSRVLFPWNFIFHSEKEKMIQWISEQPQLFVLSVHKKSFRLLKEALRNCSLKFFFFDVVLEDYDREFLDEIEKSFWNFQITIFAHKAVNIKQTGESLLNRYNRKRNCEANIANLQPLKKKWLLPFQKVFFKKNSQTAFDRKNFFQPYMYFHFPYFHKNHPKLYSTETIYHFLKETFFPPPQIDIYNLSIPEDLKLETKSAPDFSYCLSKKTPRASVIIPSYNSVQELVPTLKHLFQQDLDKSEWELIVVDDGSIDQTGQVLKSLKFLSQINFKYIFFARQKQREGFADHRFRAGIARNLGVKQAQGKFLCFLDSDILIPPSYLSSICRQLETEDIVQHPRYHLIESAPKEYSQIDKNKHTFIKGDSYWEDFYSSAENWNQKRLPWKYISTNTLCLKGSVFKQVGWFRKNYTSYGFEDTDLGYRLFQAGFCFKLNPLDTYHLYRPSEFLNSIELKQKLLGFSAKLFFHNSHCLEAYEEFSHLINQSDI